MRQPRHRPPSGRQHDEELWPKRQPGRLVVVSNRLPVTLVHDDIVPASGGLVTAMSPVLRACKGRWIGWLGAHRAKHTAALLRDATRTLGFGVEGISLTRQDVEGYYAGFSNEILWPLFHGFLSLCRFEPGSWHSYRKVNRKFARAVANTTDPADYVWVHDYHLMMVAHEMRKLASERRMGFFLHIPFPPRDTFIKLPWRDEVITALLAFDLLGFQTVRDCRNFVHCVRTLVPHVQAAAHGEQWMLTVKDRQVRCGAFPISIDYRDFVERAQNDEVSDAVATVRELLPHRKLILGIDRLDYSKGIPNRIQAFGNALRRHPELRRRTTFIQIVVPSRTLVADYKTLKDEIDRLVGAVNGEFTETGWIPIHYSYRSLAPTELLAYYRACEVALITPLQDGMNLVAKEFCACCLNEDGVLVLSEFAGAATSLGDGALLVNPFDIDATADAIHRACTMPSERRRTAMRAMRKSIEHNDIYQWVRTFLRAAMPDAGTAIDGGSTRSAA